MKAHFRGSFILATGTTLFIEGKGAKGKKENSQLLCIYLIIH